MLLFSVIMCSFEILWPFCDGNSLLKAFTYLGDGGYLVSFVAFAITLIRYILNRLDRLPQSKLLTTLFYLIPFGINFLM